jgi:hypothetical protein
MAQAICEVSLFLQVIDNFLRLQLSIERRSHWHDTLHSFWRFLARIVLSFMVTGLLYGTVYDRGNTTF